MTWLDFKQLLQVLAPYNHGKCSMLFCVQLLCVQPLYDIMRTLAVINRGVKQSSYQLITITQHTWVPLDSWNYFATLNNVHVNSNWSWATFKVHSISIKLGMSHCYMIGKRTEGYHGEYHQLYFFALYCGPP